MGRFKRQFASTYQALRDDIYAFCGAMNFSPTFQQKALFDAVMRAQSGTGPLQIACKSGQGPGKTTCSVIVALFRCLQAVDALTILTAPTMRQCNEVWLAEARRLLARADPWVQKMVTVTKTKIHIAGRHDWGVKTVTATKEENAQGFHEPNMTIICEEASGIPRPIVEQFKGTASNPNCLFLMIGNPNTRDCAFFDCFNSQRHLWETMTFNAEETPASDWFDPARNKRLEEEYGRDSDIYRIRVLGEFPHSDPNCVMSSEDIERCTDRSLLYKMVTLPRLGRLPPAKQIGLDFARFGGDESTIYRRSGNAVVEWMRFTHTDPNSVVERAYRMQIEALWKDAETWFVPDAGGMGQGVMRRFYDAGKKVVEFHNGGKAIRTQMYENKITEAWFHLAGLVKATQCCLPRDNILVQQLCGRQYFTTKKGKLVLESKDEYMKRGHVSPDRADGCVLAFYDNVEAVVQMAEHGAAKYAVGSAVGR